MALNCIFLENYYKLVYNVLMSTLQKNITGKRIALLAEKGEILFHFNDLANLWLIQNKNTLRTTLKRYCQNQLLYRIYRGFYSIKPVNEIDPVLIGAKSLHQFCYLSTETVLFQEGYLSQKIDHYTFISKKSLKFAIASHSFRCRQLKEKYLFNPCGIMGKNGLKTATIERAIADLLYFNPWYHFDHPIDWTKIKLLQKQIGYPLTTHRYDYSKTE